MKKTILYMLLIPAFIGMLAACSDAKTDAKKLQGKWNVVEVKGEKILQEGLPQMDFDMSGNKLHGTTGCNIFNTTVNLDSDDVSAITINPAATTMMACPDMELEDKMLRSLENVKGVKAGPNDNEMQLVDGAGNVLFVLSKAG